jgi:hypothetical protein
MHETQDTDGTKNLMLGISRPKKIHGLKKYAHIFRFITQNGQEVCTYFPPSGKKIPPTVAKW